MKKNSNDSDSALIEKAKNGNEGAFNFLVSKYYPRVYASLFSFTKSIQLRSFSEFLQDIKIASYHISFAVWLW